jgi:hypothetical protein
VTLIKSTKILSSFGHRLQAYAEKKLAQRENADQGQVCAKNANLKKIEKNFRS